MSPGNYWYGKKWYYLPKKVVDRCPDALTADGSKFINQDGEADLGLSVECHQDK